ncbi:MAG: LytTR family DNA-binding domain-containing protein [Lachnospiraceae bacterium]|nr:LytTR family DNA-binding domain-containing protein [Lachnospiraceae bacterium]
MLQIAVCEDEQEDRNNLIGILNSLLGKYKEEYRITNFTTGGELLQSGNSFHLIFMDIMMEGRNGIETGQELYNQNHSAKIIYTTNFGQYCMDAVNTVHAFAFLEKPVSAEALEEQVKAFLRQYRKEEVRLEFRNVSYEENGVQSEKSTLLLPVDTIMYFEYIKAMKKVRIVTENMVYEYPDVISGLEERMQPYGFETSCRGVLVNLKNVAKTKGYEVVLKSGETVPLSQKRVAQFKERLNEYIHSSGE